MSEFPVDTSHLRPDRLGRFRWGVQPNKWSAPNTTLIGKHAGRHNAALINARMKLEGEYSTQLTARQLDERDLKLAEIYARTVLTGWEGPCDAEGKPVPYSPDLFVRVCASVLADGRADALRAVFDYYADADNFTAGTSSDSLGKE